MSFLREIIPHIQASPAISQEDKNGFLQRVSAVDALTQNLLDVYAASSGQKLSLVDALHRVYPALAGSALVDLPPIHELQKLTESLHEATFDSDRIHQWGKELSFFSPRVPGTASMDETNVWLKHKLESFGLSVTLEPLRFRGVFFHSWSLKFTSRPDLDFVTFPQNNVGFGDVEAPVVDAGKGSADELHRANVKGAIILVNLGGLWDHEGPCASRERYPILALYDAAEAAGARGIVGYFEDTPGNSLRLLEPGISPMGGSNVVGPGEHGPERQYALPVLTLGRNDALTLKRVLAEGSLRARLSIKGVRKVSKTDNLVAVLPGASEETILVGSHSCTAFEGAICDTSGVVAALALAEQASRIPRQQRQKTLVFYFDSFHVWGNCCQAGLNYLQLHARDTAKIHSLLWLDHISSGGADARLSITSRHPELWAFTAASLLSRGRTPLALPIARDYILCMPGAFERQGIPVITQQAIADPLLSTVDSWSSFDKDEYTTDVLVQWEILSILDRLPFSRLAAGEPISGCGTLFTSTSTPDFPPGLAYVPEPSYPLIVGGLDEPLRILHNDEQKRSHLNT